MSPPDVRIRLDELLAFAGSGTVVKRRVGKVDDRWPYGAPHDIPGHKIFVPDAGFVNFL